MNRIFDIQFVLNNIKFVFVDYDDTLCFAYSVEDAYSEHIAWRRSMLSGDTDWYLDTNRYGASCDMKNFLELCVSNNIPCNCLTCGGSNIFYNSKKKFLDIEYPCVDSLYIAGSRERKLKFVKGFCEVMDVELNQILLIDDHPTTRSEFHEAGIFAVSPNTVINKMREFQSKQSVC